MGVVGVDGCAKGGGGAVEPGLERAERDIEDDGRLGVGKSEVVVDDEHGALLGSQATKAALQQIAGGGPVLGVGVSRRFGGRHVDLDDLALPDPPCLSVARVDEQPMEPRIEAVRVADGADMQPGGQERLLDSIGRQLVASQDQSRGPVQPVERVRRECREGVVVTFSGA